VVGISWARNLLVFTILVAVTGGQWAVLQSAAWAGMLVNNLRTQSLADAVTRTFDGQHPCPLCKAIECGKKSEKKSEIEVKATRIELPPIEKCASLVTDEFLRSAFTLIDEFSESVSAPPLFHPPRAHLA
jgi:hypothetical protein